MSETLDLDFSHAVPDTPVDHLSAGRRRTLRQRQAIARDIHPLTGTRLHAETSRTCGNCWWRQLIEHHNRKWPKCVNPSTGALTHGPGTDVRASWPACPLHSYGDPHLSDDAARWTPESVS